MRSEIVATAVAMSEKGLVVESQGNVSARDGETIWITARGVPYDRMTPDDVVPIDDARASSEWQVHAAIYAARADVEAIVHTHSPAATKLSRADSAPLPIAAYADTGTAELAVNALQALGDGDAVLLAKHGVVAVGASLNEALDRAEEVERAASRATP